MEEKSVRILEAIKDLIEVMESEGVSWEKIHAEIEDRSFGSTTRIVWATQEDTHKPFKYAIYVPEDGPSIADGF